MKATKLPSGHWRIRICIGTNEAGKRVWKSFTGEDKRTVEYQAAKFQIEHREQEAAIDRASFDAKTASLIQEKMPVLSPATTRGYNAARKWFAKNASWFSDKNLYSVTSSDLQSIVDLLANSGLSPKTVRNYFAVVTNVLSSSNICLKSPKLPQKERPKYSIPSEETVKTVIRLAIGTPLEVPILLAAFGPLRRGEICALTQDDIHGNVIHVCKDIVRSADGEWITKPPKSFSSDRYIEMPPFVIDRINEQKCIWDSRRNPDCLTQSFKRFLVRNKIQPFRFHDLRHFCCSYLHGINVPDIYIMSRSGHSTNAVLREVYTHTLQNQSKVETEKILTEFTKIGS